MSTGRAGLAAVDCDVQPQEGDGRPRRIQRRRSKGWRMPEGAIYVGRPSRWGNPFRIGMTYPRKHPLDTSMKTVRDNAHAVKLYRKWLFHQEHSADLVRELRGHDLVCWCSPDQPCHADVLLEMANA